MIVWVATGCCGSSPTNTNMASIPICIQKVTPARRAVKKPNTKSTRNNARFHDEIVSQKWRGQNEQTGARCQPKSGQEAILKRAQIACAAGSQEWPAKHSKKPGY